MSDADVEWSRVIVHADMDAFYAAIEQLDDAKLRGRPLLVGSASNRGVVLTASYEARPFGVGSAMPMQRARRLCPQALVVPPRFERYQEVSKLVMDALATFSPLVEPLSLDEAFLDMTGSARLFGDPLAIGTHIKAAVRERTGGLTASVGISATRYVAKVASGFRKPDGLTIVPAHEMRAWLAPLPVSSLWGAGPRTVERLHALGLKTIGQVASADDDELERSLGALGRRFVSLARGIDSREVVGTRRPSSMGCERTLNVDVASRESVEAHLRLAADIVAQRLRRAAKSARGVRIKLKRTNFQAITRQGLVGEATDVGAVLFARATKLLDQVQYNGPFRLVGLTAYDLDVTEPAGAQLDLLPALGSRARRLETTLDALAGRFGAGVVQRAADLDRDRGIGAAVHLDFLDRSED